MSVKPIKVKYWHTYIVEHPKFTGCLIDKDKDIGWFKNGEHHRENGPSREYTDGTKTWYLNGKYLTEQEHRIAVRQMKMKLLDIGQHSL
jgi:hypothetical protein